MSCDPPRKPPNPPSIITGKPGARSGDIVPLTLSGGAVVAAAVSTPVMSHAVVIDGRVVLVGGGSGGGGCSRTPTTGELAAGAGGHRFYVESDDDHEGAGLRRHGPDRVGGHRGRQQERDVDPVVGHQHRRRLEHGDRDAVNHGDVVR